MAVSPTIESVPLSSWATLHDGLFIVAGPCSVESRKQLMETARGISAIRRVSVLRAGVWKPRSRPGQFEGKGREALPWLQQVKKETGMPVAIEVARPDHAELALHYGIDMVWLGARTTVNPFMVQEIANALRGTGIPVLIKNPVSPDIRLWSGAIERLFLAGSKKLVAVHRGFQTHEKSIYRNVPHWDIPLQLKQEIPGLPIICDPSHIAGNKKWILEVAQKAMLLTMDGLMIESHYRPGRALTDPLQQLTPAELSRILDNAVSPAKTPDITQTVESLRGQIDEADYRILETMARRLALCKEIGRLKTRQGQGILQPDRMQDLLQDRSARGEVLGLDSSFVQAMMRLLHDESVSVQHKKKDP